ncbi:zinc-binding dehydrogenase [Actinotalea caeni]|uniref:zinc-binding dehydrogenase n=1 Tax=Actinotalea caeni TaxID=1348467 RepID=UPI0012E13EDB|nr:zinc-binding dehydrogenase [Actinotalea caeni]
MHVVVAERPGGPEVLRYEARPDPEPGAGQVRVVTEVAAITFVDTLIRAGSAVAPPATFPVVLGNGVAGTVDAVGDGVAADLVGHRVVTTTGGSGGYATHAVARVEDLHEVPTGLASDTAVALLADGRTAIALHRAAAVRAGETVVVTAAAGGVGGLLVQLLVATGARVIGLAGDARKREHARSLGADVVVDYRAPGWVEQVRRAAPEGVDVVFDGVSGDLPDLLLPAVRSGGRYVQHGAAAGRWTTIEADRAAAAGVTVVPLAAIGTPEELHRATDEALRLAAEGRLRVTVGQVFPLAEAAAAHAAIGSREALGKTLLRP